MWRFKELKAWAGLLNDLGTPVYSLFFYHSLSAAQQSEQAIQVMYYTSVIALCLHGVAAFMAFKLCESYSELGMEAAKIENAYFIGHLARFGSTIPNLVIQSFSLATASNYHVEHYLSNRHKMWGLFIGKLCSLGISMLITFSMPFTTNRKDWALWLIVAIHFTSSVAFILQIVLFGYFAATKGEVQYYAAIPNNFTVPYILPTGKIDVYTIQTNTSNYLQTLDFCSSPLDLPPTVNTSEWTCYRHEIDIAASSAPPPLPTFAPTFAPSTMYPYNTPTPVTIEYTVVCNAQANNPSISVLTNAPLDEQCYSSGWIVNATSFNCTQCEFLTIGQTNAGNTANYEAGNMALFIVKAIFFLILHVSVHRLSDDGGCCSVGTFSTGVLCCLPVIVASGITFWVYGAANMNYDPLKDLSIPTFRNCSAITEWTPLSSCYSRSEMIVVEFTIASLDSILIAMAGLACAGGIVYFVLYFLAKVAQCMIAVICQPWDRSDFKYLRRNS